MKRGGPIGVWFSIALCILALGIWTGSLLGSVAARFLSKHHRGQLEKRSGSGLVESELADLSDLEVLSLLVRAAPGENKTNYVLKEIEGIKKLKARSKTPEIQFVFDLEQGLAYVRAAMAEQQNTDGERANQHMQSAQILFKSLGWPDYSEDTLKAVTNSEFARWENARGHVANK